MATRNITGTILKPDGTAWASATLYLEIESYVAVVGTNTIISPSATSDKVVITTDGSGQFTKAAVTPADGDGAFRYKLTYPNGKYIRFDLEYGASAVDIVTLATQSNLTQAHAIHAIQQALADYMPLDATILSKSAAYTLASGDNAKTIEVTATALITCPDGLVDGFQVAIAPIGGTVTLTADTTLQYWSSGTLTTASGAVTLNGGMVTVYHAGSNVWRVAGSVTE